MVKNSLVTIDMKVFDKSIKNVIDNLSKLGKDVEKDIERLVYEAGNIVVEYAKKNHPFKNISGNLERSIHTNVKKLANDIIMAQVGSWLDYAYPVEVGTTRMSAYPYLLPAFEAKFEEVVEYITEGLGEILKARGV